MDQVSISSCSIYLEGYDLRPVPVACPIVLSRIA